MTEGAEKPDRVEGLRPQNRQPESQRGPTDAQRASREDLKGKVEDNKVEAAGHKGGLRAALLARLERWEGKLDHERKQLFTQRVERARAVDEDRDSFKGVLNSWIQLWDVSQALHSDLARAAKTGIVKAGINILGGQPKRDWLPVEEEPQAKASEVPVSK